jgi:transcription elongation factor/antiterminator RfaH
MQASASDAPAQSGRWYLAYTRPNCERKAELNLNAQGFVTFLPQIEKTVRHARRLKTVRRPLFPRYLFVRFDVERDRWLSVYGTVGVARLFTQDGRPVAVPVGIVNNLLAHSDNGVTRLDVELTRGQRVRILSGPFADLTATLMRLDEGRRVEVLLEMMGTVVPVSVDRRALAPAA